MELFSVYMLGILLSPLILCLAGYYQYCLLRDRRRYKIAKIIDSLLHKFLGEHWIEIYTSDFGPKFRCFVNLKDDKTDTIVLKDNKEKGLIFHIYLLKEPVAVSEVTRLKLLGTEVIHTNLDSAQHGFICLHQKHSSLIIRDDMNRRRSVTFTDYTAFIWRKFSENAAEQLTQLNVGLIFTAIHNLYETTKEAN